jgi:hypothetical protein
MIGRQCVIALKARLFGSMLHRIVTLPGGTDRAAQQIFDEIGEGIGLRIGARAGLRVLILQNEAQEADEGKILTGPDSSNPARYACHENWRCRSPMDT